VGVFQLGHAKLHCVTPCKTFVGIMRVDFFSRMRMCPHVQVATFRRYDRFPNLIF